MTRESARAIPVALAAAFVSLGGCDRSSSQPDSTPSNRPAQPVIVSASARFSDSTESAGLDFKQHHGGCGMRYFVEQVASGAALFDADGDGDLDAYFPQPKPVGVCKFPFQMKQRLFLNDGKGHFTLSPNAFGGNDTDYGIGAAVGDYDNDGDPDLYVSCFGKNTLYRNSGKGTFQDVTAQAGVEYGGFGTGAVFFDYDKDGFLDLYAMRYCDWNLKNDIVCPGPDGERDVCNPRIYDPSTNRLYRNNGDGWLDLFVANDLGPNYLYQNNKDGTFSEIAMQAGVAFGITGGNQANMGVAVGDYDDSGRPSVLVSVFSNEPYTLYKNEGNFFTDVSSVAGIAEPTLPYLSFGTGFLDTRNTGVLDLFFANGHVSPYYNTSFPDRPQYKQRNQLFLNQANGTFKEDLEALPKNDVRVHRGAVFGDVNADGRLDILVTANDDRPTLLLNESAQANWLLLKLTDKNGCVTPVGAVCTATIGGRRMMRMVMGGTSYGGDSDHRVHFGLGKADRVDKLEIHWLSGKQQTLENVQANQVLAVIEGP